MTDQEPTQVYQPPTVEPTAPPPAAEPPPPAPVATVPLESAPSGARPGRSKLKWLVAGLVVLLVAGTAAGATLLLTSDSGDPTVLAYTPADSVAYAELRLDLPGSQSAELAEIMKAFPGFEDQAAFPVKLSEALDLLVGQGHRWQAGLQDRHRAVVRRADRSEHRVRSPRRPIPLPRAASSCSASRTPPRPRAWADGLAAKSGAATTTETYGGETITLVEPAAGTDAKGMQAAYAVIGPVLAIGDPTSVKAVIDTDGKTGLNTNAQFKEASASVTGDRLGFAYVDLATLAKSAHGPRWRGSPMLMPSLPISLEGLTPPWVAGAVRAEDGAFVMETRSPHQASAGPATNAESKLPGVLPPTTVFLAEGHDVGKTLSPVKEQLAGVPELKDARRSRSTTRSRSSAASRRSPAGSARPALRSRSTATTIARRARHRPDRRRGRRQAVEPAQGLHPARRRPGRPHRHRGGRTTGPRSRSSTSSGLGGLVGGMSDGAVAAPTDLKIAYAVTDEVVVLGYGTDFVKGVIDAAAGESLADTERFATALTQAGKEHAVAVLARHRRRPRLRRGHGPHRQTRPTTTRISSRTSRHSIP